MWRLPRLLLLAPLLGAVAEAAPPQRDLTHRSKQARVKSDAPKDVARAVGGRIDRYCEHFQAFYDELGLKKKNDNKIVCRLFDSYDDYAAFHARSTSGGSTPAAYFSSSLNAIVLYNDETDVYLRQTLFHECSHQFLNRYTYSAPKWLNEGLAENFEGWLLEPDGALVERRVHLYDLMVLQQALAADRTLPLRELVEMEQAAFKDFRRNHPDLHGYLHYVTSWSLVHYFLVGPHEPDRALFRGYLEALCDDGPRAVFAVEDWDALEERWRTFVGALEARPQTADDHLLVAAGHRQARAWDEALASYARALELDPTKRGVRYWLGYCHMWLGDHGRAGVELEAAREEDPEDPRAPYLLGRIAAAPDADGVPRDPERALALAELTSELAGGDSPTYLEFLARCQAGVGDRRAAVRTVKRILGLVEKDERAPYEELLAELQARRPPAPE